MPPVVAAVAVALGVSTAMAVVVIVTTVITLASLAYSLYMMSTMETPKTPDALKRNQTLRSSIQPHRMIYGEVLTGGVLVYAASHGDNNAFITLVVAFTGHEVEEIKEVWLNDKLSTDPSFQIFVPAQPEEGYWQSVGDTESGYTDGTEPGWVVTKEATPARFVSHVQIAKYLGTDTQTADPLLLSITPKPSVVCSKRPSLGLDDMNVVDPMNGGAYSTYTGTGMSVFTVTVTATGAADTVHWVQNKYKGDGTTLYEVASGTVTLGFGPVTMADGILCVFGAYDTNGFGFSLSGHTVGQSWEIRAFDGAPWTVDCRLQGRSYVVVTLANNDKVFPNGIPNVRALIRGNNKIYDPRTGTTGYTDNWALCVRDYLTKGYGLDCPVGEINDDFAITAANICDEDVAMGNGTTQKRYTLNGSFTLDKTPTNIMNEILAAAYGAITWTQGQYRILPAAYYEPDLTFHGLNPDVPGLTESDLRGTIKVRPKPSMKDRFNTVKGTFISVENWQPIDFPKVTNELYKDQDGGEEIARDIQLTYITDPGRAQRIAKIMLEKSRQGMVVDFPAKWSAFPLAVGCNVPISIALLGWDQKIFTVRDWRLSPEGGIDLTLQEEAAECYDWNNGEETTVDLAQNTLLPDPNYSTPPANVKMGEELYATNVGSVIKSRVILTWDNANVRHWEVQYLPPTNTIWATLPYLTSPTATVDDTTPGPYTFRLRSQNFLGFWGDYTTITYQVLGKSAPPPPVGSFLVAAQPDGTREFSWTLENPPLDLAGYRIRYSAGSGGTFDTMTDLHSGLLLASPFESNQLAAGEYTFAIVAEDTTGNQSEARYITLTLSDPRMAGIVLSASCGALGWPGTKTGCAVDESGALVALAGVNWNGINTWTAFTAWIQNPVNPIQYDHPALDVGASTLFTPIISALCDGTATVTVSTSVNGTTWTSYAAPTAVTARYIKVRVSVAGTLPVLRSVVVHLSAQPISEEINDLDTSMLAGANRIAVGDIRLPKAKDYRIIQTVQLAIQGTGAGWTWKLIDKDTATGPRIQIYDGTGALADATIDASIKGL